MEWRTWNSFSSLRLSFTINTELYFLIPTFLIIYIIFDDSLFHKILTLSLSCSLFHTLIPSYYQIIVIKFIVVSRFSINFNFQINDFHCCFNNNTLRVENKEKSELLIIFLFFVLSFFHSFFLLSQIKHICIN